MPIVPSGKRKLMKLQQSFQVTDQDGDAVQGEMTGDPKQQGSSAFDFNQLQQNMNQPAQEGQKPSSDDIQNAVNQDPKMDMNMGSPEEESSEMDNLGTKGNNMRSFIFSVLEDLGVSSRMVMDDPDAFFQGSKDLDTGRIAGTYYLPSFTKSQQVTQDRAEQIASEIGQKFNLSQKLAPKGRNFQITFQTRDDPAQMQSGSSLDELSRGKGRGGGSAMPKAASDRRDSIYNSLKKQGFGGLNG